MSDIALQFYDAFCDVFECEPLQLFCTWHVDKTWKEQLKSKIRKFEVETEVYKQLRIVLEQTNENIFENYLSTLCEWLRNSSVTKEFAKYFDTYWVTCKEKWDIFIVLA